MKPVIRLLWFFAVACAVLVTLTIVGVIYLGHMPPVKPIPRPTASQPPPSPPQAPGPVERGSKPPEIGAAQPAPPPKPLVEDYEGWIIDTIKQYPVVQRVEIQRADGAFHLVIVVDRDTPIEEARRMGDNLVRLTKFYVEPDNGPNKFIDLGYYSYNVLVYLDDWELFQGHKAADRDLVLWMIDRPDLDWYLRD